MRYAIVAGCAAVLLGFGCSSHDDEHAEHQPPLATQVPLPEMIGLTALEDENPDPNIVEVTLVAQATTVEIDGKQVKMRGYNGLVPGPVLRAKVGDEVIVHFTNALSEPTTIHWHGLRIPDAMDGSPRVQEPVPSGGEFTYRFKIPEAGSFWYHPHVRAHVQVEAGLYAPIVVIDPAKDPTYDAERYVMLDDLSLDASGTKIEPPFSQGMPELMHGRYGALLLTNGRPSKDAHANAEQGTVERWRLVNTSNSRVMEFELEGASFRVIGTDGGLLPKPYTTKRVKMTVGQRFDLEVTYDKPGAVKLLSFEPALNEKDEVVEVSSTVFNVDVAGSARTPKAITWPEIVLPSRAADKDATITVNAVQGGEHGVEWQLNGKSHSTEPLFTFAEGQTVKLRIENMLGPEHPFHLHGQFFQVLNDDSQPGLKDTVLIPGGAGSFVEVMAYMDNPGRWMAHCHILEHAELGMMSEIVVTPKEGTVAPPASGGHGH